MIYVLLIENIVIITEDENLGVPLYTLPWELDVLKKSMRRWRLGEGKYKPGCIDWIEDNKYLPNCPAVNLHILSADWEKDLGWCIERLKKLGWSIEEKDLGKDLHYTCDVHGRLEDVYGERLGGLIWKFWCLPEFEKNLLNRVENESGKDKKLGLILENSEETVRDVYEFLPPDYKSSIIFQDLGTNKNWIPEFGNLEKLGGDVVDNPEKYLKEEIYRVFQIGSKYEGPEIKDLLVGIYKKLGIPGEDKIRVQDLFKYFEISFFKHSGKGKYNLIRKIL